MIMLITIIITVIIKVIKEREIVKKYDDLIDETKSSRQWTRCMWY